MLGRVVSRCASGIAGAMWVAAAGCSSAPPPESAPAPLVPEATVEQFLGAVNRGDLKRMAELWGTERGSSLRSVPQPERQRRLTIMQRLLHHDSFAVLRVETMPQSPERRRVFSVELVRGTQRVTVPFVLVRARSGEWLVEQIDLAAVAAGMQPSAGRRRSP